MNFIDQAILISIKPPYSEEWDEQEAVSEIVSLAETALAQVLACEVIQVKRISSAFYIGPGKVSDIADLVESLEATVVILDILLSPAQLKNIQKAVNVPVIDRAQLILDIFARRARTNEAKLQVELAQLHYLLPRLTRQWLHLSRQEGGIGTRGPGEKQLEVDRRLIRSRIKHLTQRLKNITNRREIQRKQRIRRGHPLVSLIGYTNAGKTTLFNTLSKETKLVEDRLFATLDPSIRTTILPSGYTILISDTVGFIRNLPHELIESFKATLEEVIHADLLVHVIDASDPLLDHKIQVVNTVLNELKADEKEMLLVYNKCDLFDTDEQKLQDILRKKSAITISALQKTGLHSLLTHIDQFFSKKRQILHVRIPHDKADVISFIHREGAVKKKKYNKKTVSMDVEIPEQFAHKLKEFVVKNRILED